MNEFYLILTPIGFGILAYLAGFLDAVGSLASMFFGVLIVVASGLGYFIMLLSRFRRTMLVKKANPIKIEFVVRGYLYGLAWENYRKGKPTSGIELPRGLRKAEKLPGPILTPTTKAEVGHDIELTKREVVDRVGKDVAGEIEETCLKVFENASKRSEANGLIIADTKFEFGFCGDELIQIDELLTPDSSRLWPLDRYEVGKDQYSFDKQHTRDYLLGTGWNKRPPAPALPEEVISQTSERYVECYERLTGRRF